VCCVVDSVWWQEATRTQSSDVCSVTILFGPGRCTGGQNALDTPGHPSCREGKWNVNEEGTAIKMAWHAKPEYMETGGSNAACGSSHNASLCFEVPASRHRPLVANRIALYHYVTKSSADFKDKVNRGGGVPFFTRDIDWVRTIERCAAAWLVSLRKPERTLLC
jgi:hypothetical protein